MMKVKPTKCIIINNFSLVFLSVLVNFACWGSTNFAAWTMHFQIMMKVKPTNPHYQVEKKTLFEV
jgi:hypothetical protein